MKSVSPLLNLHDENFPDKDRESVRIIFESLAQPLTEPQRIVFFTVTVVIAVCGSVGNFLVLYVNFSRKLRFLFKSCLISLAVSDLLVISVTTVTYTSKFHSSRTSLWELGGYACTLMPFSQTMAVLVNSILLVFIALDRYKAVERINKGPWEPSKPFCVVCCMLVWSFAAAVSSPMLKMYEFKKVFVIPDYLKGVMTRDDSNVDYYEGFFCGRSEYDSFYYFALLFSLVFLPFLIIFLWLNTILAKTIWKHRNQEAVNKKNIPTISRKVISLMSKEVAERRLQRKQRQLRMFKVILLLMAVFIICRVPNYVFIFFKIRFGADENVYWVLYFTFGLLTAVNCMLNPLLYSFLSETIRATNFVTDILRGFLKPFERLSKAITKKSEN